jgi:flavin-dependent dehydrogenase
VIVILGGGPAGAAAASTLARLGHAVRLITRPARAGAARLAESLPPSVGRLFAAIGAADLMERAPFVRTRGNTVCWGGGAPRVVPFPDEARGWQVETGALEQVLLQAASRAGAAIERRIVTDDEAAALAASDGRGPDAASFVLDCTGRAGVLARRLGERIYEPVLRSVALVGVWHRPGGWPVPDDTHTLLESYDNGWTWSVPVAPETRYVAVMVDPGRAPLERGQRAADVYLHELARAPWFASLFLDSTRAGGPWGWDAAMYAATRTVIGRTLLVGDAASFVDPLSSAGVRKALASGWTAAVTVHTALTEPAMRTTALSYFEDRERRMYADLRRLATRHLAAAASAHDTAFWSDRHFEEETPPPSPATTDAVHAALDRIRRSGRLRLGAGAVRFCQGAAIQGHRIVLETRLASAAVPEGTRFVRGVDVVRLLDVAPACDDVPAAFEVYRRAVAPAGLDAFLTALATAVACGWLVLEGSDGGKG